MFRDNSNSTASKAPTDINNETKSIVAEVKNIPLQQQVLDLIVKLENTIKRNIKTRQTMLDTEEKSQTAEAFWSAMSEDGGSTQMPSREPAYFTQQKSQIEQNELFYNIIIHILNNLAKSITDISPKHLALLCAYRTIEPSLAPQIDNIVAQLKIEQPLQFARLSVELTARTLEIEAQQKFYSAAAIDQLRPVHQALVVLENKTEILNRRLAFLAAGAASNSEEKAQTFAHRILSGPSETDPLAMREQAIIENIFLCADLETPYETAQRKNERPASSSVMRQEGVDTAWVSNIHITPNSDGICSVDIKIAATQSASVCNTAENTRVVSPDESLPTDIYQRDAALASIVATEGRVNAKHFILTKFAREYLALLNAEDASYTDSLVKKTNLYYAELSEVKVEERLPKGRTIHILDADNSEECAKVSSFQKAMLPWFRELTDETNKIKAQERYDLAAFNRRAVTPEVVVYILQQGEELLGTFTLNLHLLQKDYLEQPIRTAQTLATFGYLSDLFVAKGLDNNPELITQFIGNMFADIRERFPNLKVLSVMAASGKESIPIVKCFAHAMQAKLIYPFTRAEQERLGIISQFTFKPQENAGNNHSALTPLRAVSIYSVASRSVVTQEVKALERQVLSRR